MIYRIILTVMPVLSYRKLSNISLLFKVFENFWGSAQVGIGQIWGLTSLICSKLYEDSMWNLILLFMIKHSCYLCRMPKKWFIFLVVFIYGKQPYVPT